MSDLEGIIAEAMRVERARAGLTQEELGQRIGLSGQAIWRIEHGQRSFPLAKAPSLCRALGLSLAEFLQGADEDELDALGL